MAETITIKDRTFTVGDLSARDGSWVLNLVLSKKMPFDMSMLIGGADNSPLAEAEFHALRERVLPYVTETVKVHGPDGQMLDHVAPIMVKGQLIPSLEKELYIVSELIAGTIIVNVAPFFRDRVAALKAKAPTNP
jgi:hypothetical protein